MTKIHHFTTVFISLINFANCLELESVTWRKESPILLGHDAKLFCDASNMSDCCSQRTRRWHGGASNSVLLSNGVSTNPSKYTEILSLNGFSILIKNILEEDVNVSYTCTYGYEVYTDILLLDKIQAENSNTSVLVPVLIAVAIVIVIAGVLLVIYFRRKHSKGHQDVHKGEELLKKT